MTIGKPYRAYIPQFIHWKVNFWNGIDKMVIYDVVVQFLIEISL